MTDKIECPNCGYHFDVEDALSGKIEAHFKAEFEKKSLDQADKIKKEQEKIELQRKALMEQQEKHNELLQQELKKVLVAEKQKIEKQAQEASAEKLKSVMEENERRKKENQQLRQKEVDLLKLENELKDAKESFELDLQKKLLQEQSHIEEKARAKERESFELERIKLLKQIDDNKKLAEEMKRKAEQGSMQLQGEVQEIALENMLAQQYPFDSIEEVAKGVRGADCIQKVINHVQKECGSIVYESKRTKNFSNEWIDKLKQDLIACKADIAVLVTETMPKDMDKFGEKDGIWICGFHEVKSLSFVLREMLIRTQSVKSSQENKGDKMELLYSYLTSSEFVQNIERIVENYDAMFDQLNKEKKAMNKIWSIREKQIWVVQENLSSLFGSIKGIAGKELESSNVLELPDKTFDE